MSCFNDQYCLLPWIQQPAYHMGSKDQYSDWLTNLCERRKMPMHVTSFFLLKPYLLSVYICAYIYIYECINMYVIHILLQGLEKKLRIWAGMRKIFRSSLKVKSHELNSTSDDMYHCHQIHHILLFHNACNLSCLVLPRVLRVWGKTIPWESLLSTREIAREASNPLELPENSGHTLDMNTAN